MTAPRSSNPSTGRIAFGLVVAPLITPVPVTLLGLLFPVLILPTGTTSVSTRDMVAFVFTMNVLGLVTAYLVAICLALPLLAFLARRVLLSAPLVLCLGALVGVLFPLLINAVIAVVSPATGFEWSAFLHPAALSGPTGLLIATVLWLVSFRQHFFSHSL